MKIRQAQTSATYILPDPGELNKRVLIRQRVDMPADNFGVESQYPVTFRTWAKVIQTSATTWQETAQTGDAITHYITIRYRRGITADYEVVCGDSVYPQGELKVSRISEAISGANGEYSHQLLAPADNISIAKNELAVLGTISWT